MIIRLPYGSENVNSLFCLQDKVSVLSFDAFLRNWLKAQWSKSQKLSDDIYESAGVKCQFLLSLSLHKFSFTLLSLNMTVNFQSNL